VEVLAGRQTRPDPGFEEVGEVALRELGTNIGAVACFLEKVRVRVERHARSGVAEDAADLGDVEADVDDQVAGEGVAKVVEAQPSPVASSPASAAAPDAGPASRRCGAGTRCRARLRTRNRSRG